MKIEIRVPPLPESLADALLVSWHRQPGERVARDENLADLETDKVVLEIPAPQGGVLSEVLVPAGTTVTSGRVIAMLDTDAAAVTPPVPARAPMPHVPATPAAPAGRRGERRVPMTRLRERIASRLVETQNSRALLTTFNEVDLTALDALRARHGERFERDHGIALGRMAFFVGAAVAALGRHRIVNASLDGNDIVYHDTCDIGVEIATDHGSVVPVLKDAGNLPFPDIVRALAGYAERARQGTLTLEELTGGTFTLSHAGQYGALMSRPIVNPPQSGVVALHEVLDRAVVIEGAVVVRPMMYLSLTYDHRIIDGRDSVGFLVTFKSLIEDPARLLLGI